MPKISIISPTIRPDGLKIVEKSLKKQTFKDFEWIVSDANPHSTYWIKLPHRLLYDCPKKKGEFYKLNSSWNNMINAAKGELIVFIVDNTEFPTNTLELLWEHYTTNPTTCISGVGSQFDGDKLVWQDPRMQFEKVHPIAPMDMEFRLASIPKRAIQAVGGLDEAYDTVVANSEKELCMRIFSLGYLFLIDQRIHYKFYKHEDHGKKWDKLYIKSCELLQAHKNEIQVGKRLRLNYVTS